MEWVATGRVFDAAEALAGRLVSRVVPGGELKHGLCLQYVTAAGRRAGIRA